jgi:hypothetical protein
VDGLRDFAEVVVGETKNIPIVSRAPKRARFRTFERQSWRCGFAVSACDSVTGGVRKTPSQTLS